MTTYEFNQFLERLPSIKSSITLSISFNSINKSSSSKTQPRQVLVVVGSKALSQVNPVVVSGPAYNLFTLVSNALLMFASNQAEAVSRKPSKAEAPANTSVSTGDDKDKAPVFDEEAIEAAALAETDTSLASPEAAKPAVDDAASERAITEPEPPSEPTLKPPVARTLF